MNHGYCINCWWYKMLQGPYWVVTQRGLVEKKGHGLCYMHNGDNGPYQETNGDSYCPDYTNKKRKVCGMASVDDFIKTL